MKYKIVAGLLALAVMVAAIAAVFNTQEAEAAPVEIDAVSVSKWTGVVYGTVINSPSFYTFDLPNLNTDPAITLHVSPWTGQVYHFAGGTAPSSYGAISISGDGTVELYMNRYTGQLSVAPSYYSTVVLL